MVPRATVSQRTLSTRRTATFNKPHSYGYGNCLVPRATASQRTLSTKSAHLLATVGTLWGSSLGRSWVHFCVKRPFSGHLRSRNDHSPPSLNRFHSFVPVNSLRQILSVGRCSSNFLGGCSFLSRPIAFRNTVRCAPYLCLYLIELTRHTGRICTPHLI